MYTATFWECNGEPDRNLRSVVQEWKSGHFPCPIVRCSGVMFKFESFLLSPGTFKKSMEVADALVAKEWHAWLSS